MRDIEEITNDCREELERLWEHYDESMKAKLTLEAKSTMSKIIGIEFALNKVLDHGY